MKNRIRKIKAEKTANDTPKAKELVLRLRFTAEQYEQFVKNAHDYGLTKEQMASAVLRVDFKSEGQDFEEAGCHLLAAAIELYPERAETLEMVWNAFEALDKATDKMNRVRSKAALEIEDDGVSPDQLRIAHFFTSRGA